LLARLGSGCCGPARYAIFGIAVALTVWGGLQMRYLTVGDARPGSPLLWPDSNYNVSVDHINEKFQGTEQLFVIVDGKPEGAIKSPQVLETIEALQLYLEESPHVGGTSTVADLLKQVNKTLRNNDPRWWLLPSTETDAAQLFGIIEYQSEPGDLARWINYNVTDANVIVFLRDHRGDTIRDIIRQIKNFIANQPTDGADFRLAGGLVGVLAAANEVIGWADAMNLILALSAMFVFCAIAYRSFVAGGLFVLILGISNLVSAALLAHRGIGLNVNNLPVISLGIGFGVDYGIYVVSRIIEEYRRLRDLGAAVTTGVSTAGKAVLYTALIVTVGIIFWRFSPLRFQAEMGEQLAIILILNMLGGLFLLPSLIYLFRPKFVTENRNSIAA
jgi:predicted RND superfamily exporter protein